MSFVHLHLHSEHSFDGQISVSGRSSQALMNRLKELGQTAAALTDHGTMRGVVDFYFACRQHGIKPLLGCEIYVSPFPESPPGAAGNGYFHLTLIAKNSTGYSGLCQMMSTVQPLDSDIVKSSSIGPEHCVAPETLARFSQGLICLTGCLSGPVSRALFSGDYRLARERLQFLKDIFREDLFVELMNHGLPEQRQINPLLLKLARELNIMPAASNDVHYITPKAHEQLYLIPNLSDDADSGQTHDESEYPLLHPAEYLKSEQEMLAAFAFCPEAVRNTQAIAGRVDDDIFADIFEAVSSYSENIPKYRHPQNLSADAFLKELCLKGQRERLGRQWNEAYRQRLEQELQIIAAKHFADYFLLVWDYVSRARELGALIGPGWGNAGCSLINYLLGLTAIDPLRYNLPFANFFSGGQFLNIASFRHPHIVTAINSFAQPQTAAYIYRKYGEEYAAFLDSTHDPLTGLMSLVLLADDKNISIKELAPCPPAPVSLIPGPSTRFGYDASAAEWLGLVKADLCASRQLEALLLAQQRLTASAEPEAAGFSLNALIDNPADPRVYALLSTGACEGIFEDEAIKIQRRIYGLGAENPPDLPNLPDCLRRLQPERLSDLAALLALYPAAAADSGCLDGFIAARHLPQAEIDYLHPLLKPILSETYGIFIYPEQFMQVFRELGGFGWDEADIAQSVMRRRKLDKISQMRPLFIQGARQRGLSEAKARKIFAALERSPANVCSKSHALGLTLTAYCLAYLKCHYPKIYQAALLCCRD